MSQCKSCGKAALPNQDYCMMCSPKDRNPGRRIDPRTGQGATRPGASVPPDCIFKNTFYSDDGYLKREVSIESAEKMAQILARERMTQTSFRQLFNQLKSIEQQLHFRPSLGSGFLREKFGEFMVLVEYQVGRGVVKEVFKDLLKSHSDMVMHDPKEFFGFLKYITAILARMPRDRR